MAIGVTRYSWLPSVVVLGLVITSEIVEPHAAPQLLAPVTEPTFAPSVQVNVLGTVAVRLILVAAPVQLACAEVVFTVGVPLIVTTTDGVAHPLV